MDLIPKEEVRHDIRLSIRINIIELKELIDAYLEKDEENAILKAKIIELEEQTKK